MSKTANVQETKVKISLADEMSAGLGKIDSMLDQFGMKLPKLSTAMTTMFAATAAALAHAGVEVSKFQNQFISFAGTAERAGEMYNTFNEVARNMNTSYSEQQIYDMGKAFLAVGVNAEEAAKLIEKSTNAAAALGKGPEFAKELQDAFVRLKTEGELTERQFKSLAEAGIDLTAVQDEMLKGGKVAFEALSKELERYDGAMAKTKNTASEMAADVSANCTELLRQTALMIDEFFGFSDALKELFQWIIDITGRCIASIKSMIGAMREAKASAGDHADVIAEIGTAEEAIEGLSGQAAVEAAAKWQETYNIRMSALKAERKEAEALEELYKPTTGPVKAIKKPSAGGGGSAGKVKIDTSEKDYEKALKALNQLTDSLNIKAVETTGNVFAIGTAKLKAEVNKMNDIIKDAAKQGIDTSKQVSAVRAYEIAKQFELKKAAVIAEYEMDKQRIENERNSGNLSLSEYKARQVTKAQEYKRHLEDLLKNDKLSAEKRLEIETKLADATKTIRDNSAKSMKDIWKEVMEDLEQTTFNQTQTIKNGIKSLAESFTNFGQNLLTDGKSLTERLDGLFKDLANNIMNTMMKVYMQGLFSKMFSGLGGLFGAADGGYVGVRAFAGGGYAGSGWGLVGERGPELVNFSQPGRVYNAEQTSKALNAGANVNIKFDLQNNTGTPMEAQQTGTSFDGENYVIGVVLNAVATNKGGMRTMLKGI